MNKFIFPIHTKQSKQAILYFPYAGAGAYTAYKFLPHISKFCSLFAVQLPGRENRLNESAIYNHETIYHSIAKELQNYSEFDFIFWGHSLGSLLAFETISFLEKHNMQAPKHLIVSGSRAPKELDQSIQFHKLSDNDLIQELKKFGGLTTIPNDDPLFNSLFLPILRQDCFLLDTYKFNSNNLISANIFVFTGDTDLAVPVQLAESWKSLTTGSFQFNLCSGNHFFIHDLKSNFPLHLADTLSQITEQ